VINESVPSNSIFLIADQSEDGRKKLKEGLNQLGYHYIIEGENAHAALTKMEIGANTGSPITVVLCDWSIAGDKGLEFLLKVRSFSFSSRTPILITTSHQDLPIVLRKANKHIEGYIVKPYTPESLRINLEAIFAGISA